MLFYTHFCAQFSHTIQQKHQKVEKGDDCICHLVIISFVCDLSTLGINEHCAVEPVLSGAFSLLLLVRDILL